MAEARPPAIERALALCAPGRLHLGFLDPAASLGRRFGSLGLVIDGFETVVEISAASHPAPGNHIVAASPAAQAEVERAAAHLHTLQQRSQRQQPVQLRLVQVLPAHAGFGSGTQLALAIGRAFAQWHGLPLPTLAIAQWLSRGLRSGVGIAGFDQGGLLLDGGPGADGVPAPVLSRLALPEDWRILVVQDSSHRGLSGAHEREAIATLPPLPRAHAADICHQVLMRVLPGAASADFDAFARGLSQVQRVLGAHFAPAQGGTAFTSAAVGRLVGWMGYASGGDGHAATGQSSWGPTGFVVVPSLQLAQALLQRAREEKRLDGGLIVSIVGARNHGATFSERPCTRSSSSTQ